MLKLLATILIFCLLLHVKEIDSNDLNYLSGLIRSDWTPDYIPVSKQNHILHYWCYLMLQPAPCLGDLCIMKLYPPI